MKENQSISVQLIQKLLQTIHKRFLLLFYKWSNWFRDKGFNYDAIQGKSSLFHVSFVHCDARKGSFLKSIDSWSVCVCKYFVGEG